MSPRLHRAGRQAVISWGKAVHGYRVAGREHIPATGGVLVVCNHLADSDGAFVGAAAPSGRMPIHLVTARHHDSSPLVEGLLLRLGLEPVRAGDAGIAALRFSRDHLRGGGMVVIYPEGLPGFGARVGPFADGAGWLALTPGVTVVPAAVWGTHRVMRRGLPVGRGPVRVAFGAPVGLEGMEGGRPARAGRATARIRERVQRLVTSLAVADPG